MKHLKIAYTLAAIFFLVLLVGPVLATDTGYQIGPGDVLKISVYDHPDLTTVARVDDAGSIGFPLAGQIAIGGQTATAAAQTIAAVLNGGYIINPQVAVFIEKFRSTGVVYVTGQVNRPAAYSVEPDMTVIKAVTMAGGFTPLAAQGRIKIIRKIDGSEQEIKRVSLHEKVAADDVIVIPESFF